MFTFLVIITTLLFIVLIIVVNIRPSRSTMSLFELQRRSNNGDTDATVILRRERLLNDIYSLQRAITALLLVATVLLCIITFGWTIGVFIALLIALEYGPVAQVIPLKSTSQRLYKKIEPHLLDFVEHFPRLMVFLRSVALETDIKQLSSREELQHLVAQSGSILSSDEKKLIEHSLRFETRQVNEIMTPRSVIESIAKTELLGPLILDRLHKTGHNRFPVIDKDIDHVVGTLYVQDLMALDNKKSITAGKAMESHVFYVNENQTLQHALMAFLRTHHHLFIVVNEFRETAGLITIEDVLEALLGRKIIDEFDIHDDLRVVAARNPRKNNRNSNSQDV